MLGTLDIFLDRTLGNPGYSSSADSSRTDTDRRIRMDSHGFARIRTDSHGFKRIRIQMKLVPYSIARGASDCSCFVVTW